MGDRQRRRRSDEEQEGQARQRQEQAAPQRDPARAAQQQRDQARQSRGQPAQQQNGQGRGSEPTQQSTAQGRGSQAIQQPRAQAELESRLADEMLSLTQCRDLIAQLHWVLARLGIIAREEIQTFRPPLGQTTYLAMLEHHERQLQSFEHQGPRSSERRRHWQATDALELIAKLRRLYTRLPQDELQAMMDQATDRQIQAMFARRARGQASIR